MSCILLKKKVYNTVKYVTLEPTERISYQTKGSAGVDVCSNTLYTIPPNTTEMIGTGLFLDMPENVFAQLSLRSSMGKAGLLMPHGVGIIDSDYRGEILVLVYNYTKQNIVVKSGQRIAQLVFINQLPIELSKVDAVGKTDRGTGGFGSTGTSGY